MYYVWLSCNYYYTSYCAFSCFPIDNIILHVIRIHTTGARNYYHPYRHADTPAVTYACGVIHCSSFSVVLYIFLVVCTPILSRGRDIDYGGDRGTHVVLVSLCTYSALASGRLCVSALCPPVCRDERRAVDL